MAEARLWLGLRQLRKLGLAHFPRQAPIGPYIVDFADLGRRIIVEADRGQHAGPVDRRRDAFLAAEGFVVLRFWNGDILGNPDGVLASILQAVRSAPPTRALPPRGRESRPEWATGSPPPRGEGMGVGRRPRRPRRGGA